MQENQSQITIKQEKLNKYIFKWARPSKRTSLNVEQRYEAHKKDIKDIYSNEFRHSYSQIFHVLGQINNSNSENYTLEALSLNIDIFYNKLINDKDRDSDLEKQILKLYDHINLDIARFTFMNTIDEENKNSISDVTNTLNEAKNAINVAKDEAKIVNRKANNMQKENITILGIFASIVITFSFVGTLSTSILSNIDKVNISSLLLIICALGLLSINILISLYNFILKINEKEKMSIFIINIILIISIILLFIISWLDSSIFFKLKF